LEAEANDGHLTAFHSQYADYAGLITVGFDGDLKVMRVNATISRSRVFNRFQGDSVFRSHRHAKSIRRWCPAALNRVQSVAIAGWIFLH
jgi:hypothetical protein